MPSTKLEVQALAARADFLETELEGVWWAKTTQQDQCRRHSWRFDRQQVGRNQTLYNYTAHSKQ